MYTNMLGIIFALMVSGVVGDCRSECNQLVSELPQALDCRTYRMMLPRPKVGKACTSAYDDAAITACVAACENEPIPARDGKSADFCRKYIQEYPKPTVHKSCRTGYSLGFDRGLDGGKNLATRGVTIDTTTSIAQPEQSPEELPDDIPEETPEAEPVTERRLLVSMPVTVDDTEIHLEIFSGEDAIARIGAFCAEHMADSQESCARQLTPHVERKLASI